MHAVAVWSLLGVLWLLAILSVIVPAEKCSINTPFFCFWVAVPPAMKSPVAITLQTGVPRLAFASANEKRWVGGDAAAPAETRSAGTRKAAAVAVTERMSLRTCVSPSLPASAGGRLVRQ